MKEEYQEIYINLDDSGKLSKKEKISVYGGIVFLSKKEKDKFITQYRDIINNIKCKYCPFNKRDCSNSCPEIKNTNIKATDKRRVMNYLKKHFIVSLVIRNNKIYDHIMNSKSSKGRYIDYTLRRLIKDTVKELIKLKKIDPCKPVRVIVNIDQQTTKSNGYYNLRDGIVEDLLYGISNFDYNSTFPPILFSKLDLRITYQNSDKSFVIQAADLLAGTIRRSCINCLACNKKMSEELNIVNLKIFFP